MPNFATRLHDAIRRAKTPALVGLDPRWDLLPAELRKDAGGETLAVRAAALERFCLRVIDVIAPLVPAVKPQSAFFEECGPPGVTALAKVIRAARRAGLIVLCDAKRGDIGSTAQAYAAAYLAGTDPQAAPFAADALTINPYLGMDSLQPFVDLACQRGAGLYVLVRTSNPGARDFQDRKTEGQTLYQTIAQSVESLSNRLRVSDPYGPLGAVVGATYPEQLIELRQNMPHVPLLVPGYGTQGGNSRDVAPAFDPQGLGALINSSRGILYAFRSGPLAEEFGEDKWEQAVAAATQRMIEDLAENTPAGKLRD